MQEVLNGANCLPINKELYVLEKRDPVYNEIEKLFNVSLDLKYARVEEMRKYKKAIFHYKKYNDKKQWLSNYKWLNTIFIFFELQNWGYRT